MATSLLLRATAFDRASSRAPSPTTPAIKYATQRITFCSSPSPDNSTGVSSGG